MYSDSGSTSFPTSTISVSVRLLACASSSVGSSSLRPLTRMRSASLSSPATLGSGSNVWLFVPSGTIPWTSTRSPPMLAAIEVIGETVVATRSLSPFPPCAESSDEPQPARRSPAAKPIAAIRMRTPFLAAPDGRAMPKPRLAPVFLQKSCRNAPRLRDPPRINAGSGVRAHRGRATDH